MFAPACHIFCASAVLDSVLLRFILDSAKISLIELNWVKHSWTVERRILPTAVPLYIRSINFSTYVSLFTDCPVYLGRLARQSTVLTRPLIYRS